MRAYHQTLPSALKGKYSWVEAFYDYKVTSVLPTWFKERALEAETEGLMDDGYLIIHSSRGVTQPVKDRCPKTIGCPHHVPHISCSLDGVWGA